MPISHEAAVARARKAAATRAYNKAHGITTSKAPRTPAFPKTYHATPTRHVTHDLKMKEPTRKKHPVPARMGGELPYTIRDEYRKRAAATHGELPRIKEHRARRGVKKQRGTK